MMAFSPVSYRKSSPFAESSFIKGNWMHFIWHTGVSSFGTESGYHITGRFCDSFPPILVRHVLRMKGPPLFSLSPLPMALESVSFTSWQWPAAGFPACLLWRQETQRRCLGDWGQLSQWHGLCTPHWALCQGHWGSRVTELGPQPQKDLPALPTLATLVPGYRNHLHSLKTRCGVMKDSLDTDFLQNLHNCDIPGIKSQYCMFYFTLPYLN